MTFAPRKAINREFANRNAVNRGFMAALAALFLAMAVLSLSRGASALDEPNDVFLFIDDYTNDSIVDAMASLNFPSSPPPPNKVDNILFEWFAPNVTLVHSESVDPNDNAWAPSSYRVNALGLWTVNATYTTNTSIH